MTIDIDQLRKIKKAITVANEGNTIQNNMNSQTQGETYQSNLFFCEFIFAINISR